MSVADVQTAREGIRRGELEANRWGVLLDEATAMRAAIRRGSDGEDPGADLIAAFERFVVPMTRDGEAATGSGGHPRGENLEYLRSETFVLPPGDQAPGGGSSEEGAGNGGPVEHPDFFTYAGGHGGKLGDFVNALETFVNERSRDPSAVTSAFETAVQTAVSEAPAKPKPLANLIELLTAGVRAARAHREFFEAKLTNDFDEEVQRGVGTLQQFHDGLSGQETSYAEGLFESLGEYPVAMLPVGIETSFEDVGSEGDQRHELRVRVYPDDVHVDTHEPELTTEEERWGKVFWTQVYTGRFHYTDPSSDPPLSKSTVTDKVPDDVAGVAERTFWADSGREGTRFVDYSDDVESRYDQIKERAWELLIERAGRERAAYIVRRTEPVDTSDAGDPETAESVLAGPPEASDPETANGAIDDLEFTDVANRPDTWTRQPRARYLPGRWLVRLEWTDATGTERSEWVHAEYTVDQPLYLGPDPDSVAVADADRDVEDGDPGTRSETGTPDRALDAVDAGMEWMVDFAEARRRGMALRITPEDLGVSSLPDHFDRLTVTGVRASTTPEAATEELGELFAHQRYTDGLELLPSGTPTNNHDGTKSGYRREEPPEQSLAIEASAPLTGPTDPTDGTLLAQCLGLQTTDDHAFAHVEGADGTEWLDGHVLQRALFSGTLGYTLRQLLVPDAIYDGSASDADRAAAEKRYEAIRDHFLHYVRASGPFPALRIDDQPYGILPAMSIDASDDGSDAGVDGATMIRDIVQFLRPFWAQSVSEVPTAGHETSSGGGSGSPLERVRQVLQRGAVADAYTRRLFIENRASRYHRLTQTLSSHGVSYDPRVSRLVEFDPGSVHRYSEYGHGEYEAISGSETGENGDEPSGYGTDRPSLITTVARPDPDNAFLGALPRMLNSDLVKFGMEPHLERFPGLVTTAYHDQAPISTWDGVSGIFDDDVTGAIKEWLRGDVSEPSVALYRLFDRSGSEVFNGYTDGGTGMSTGLAAENAAAVVEYVLTEGGSGSLEFDLSSVEESKVVAAVEVLFVDALDQWLGTNSVNFGPTSGKLPSMTALDGTDLTADNIAYYETELEKRLEDPLRRTNIDWPEGAEMVGRFYEGAVEANLPDNSEENSAQTQMAYNLARVFGDRLLRKHFADYVILGSTIRGSSDEYFPHTFPSDAGRNVIPTTARKVEQGDRPSFEAKRVHDTALFPQLLRFSTINAGLEALASIDPDSQSFSPSDLFERHGAVDGPGDGRYDLLENNTSRDTYEAWGRITHRGGFDELTDGFAGTRWNGLLNAMRYEGFVGKPETPEEFQAFQACLEYMADEAWLSPDRVDWTRRLVSGTLDLASHRLDAWWTSLATRRLMELRSASGDDSFDLDLSDVWVNRTPDEQNDTYVPDWSRLSLDTPTGTSETYVGAYGVVEDLVRDGATVSEEGASMEDVEVDVDGQHETVGDEITATTVEETLREVEWLDTPPRTDGGAPVEAEYLQAPSIPKATTAAILRSGHRSEPSSGVKDTLSVDLSPLRVQKAKWVLDGLRGGLWLGELMGYYFERRLHEVGEDTGVSVEQYISDFREYAPFQSDEIDHDEDDGGDGGVEAGTTGGDGEKSSGAKYDLVDGYDLYQEANESSVDAVLDEVRIPRGTDARDWAAKVFGEIDEILDALGDLIVAENVHQLQQGNFGQAGRSLKALSEGKHPRSPEVLDTNRETVGVSHRLLVLFGLTGDPPGSDETPPADWDVNRKKDVPKFDDDGSLSLKDGDPQRSSTETVVRDDGAPVLNAFAGELFPSPKDVLCSATYRWETEPENDGEPTSHEVTVSNGVSLDDLTLSPLDALYLTQQSGDAGQSKLENHVAYHLLRHRDDHEGQATIPSDADLDVAFRELPPNADGDETTIGEFIEHARSLRDLVLDTRTVNATDLGHPGDGIESERVAKDPVIARANTATGRLRSVRDALDNRLDVVGQPEEAAVEDLTASGESTLSDIIRLAENPRETDIRADDDPAPIVPQVDAMEDVLDDLEDAVPLSSMETTARALSGEELRTELGTLLDYLPAGPTDRNRATEPETVQQGSSSVDLDVPVARADAFAPPTTVTVKGKHGDRTRAYYVAAVDPETGTSQQVEVPNGGDRFEVEVDLEPFARPNESVFRTVEFGILEGDGVIEAIEPGAPGDLTSYGREFTLGIVPSEAAAGDFAQPPTSLDVSLFSTSPSSRVRDSTSAEVDDDGNCSPPIDVGNAVVGTPFTVVATYETDGGSHVAATTDGRVVGTDPANGIDDDLLGGMNSLPRFLWLVGFDDAMSYRGPGSSDDEDPSPAWRLDQRLYRVPWSAVDREKALFPSTNSTYDQADADAVQALSDCSTVDLSRAAGVLTGSSATRGLAPLAELLGLPDAVSVVGQDDPYGDQTFFAPDDPESLATARDRIEAFLDDPWPGGVQWDEPALHLIDSGLVAFVLDRGAGDGLEALLELIEDDAWTPTTLDRLVSDPGAFLSALDDLLYHPGEGQDGTQATVVTGLEEIASTARSPRGRAGDALDRFDEVEKPVRDVADPLSTLATTLDGATIPDGGGTGSTFDTTVGTWTTDLADELSPLVDALAEADLSDSFREGLLETLRRPMVRAAYFGVYGAMPAAASGGSETDRKNLSRQAEAVLEEVERRLPPEDAAEPGTLDEATDRLESIFGENYTVLPPFSPGNVTEVRRTFANDGLLSDDDASAGPLPVQTWLQRSARVRERPGMLRETLLYGEVATGDPHLRFDVGQLPHEPDDSWVGLDGVRPGGRDRVSLVAHTDEEFDAIVDGTASGPSRLFAGLAVDEWVERVPAQEETTSVAVRYDEPDNEPPQSILLATPPEPPSDGGPDATPWSLSTVEATFDETMAMTRYRGVTLEDLRPDADEDRWMLGKLLPALFFAQDTHVQPNTPSLDLTSLDRFEDEAGALLFAPWLLEANPMVGQFSDVDVTTFDTTVTGVVDSGGDDE